MKNKSRTEAEMKESRTEGENSGIKFNIVYW